MPISPDRPEFKAAVKMEDIPPPIERALSYVRSALVKSLYRKQLIIAFLAIFWLVAGFASVGFGLATLAGKVAAISPDDAIMVGSPAMALGIFAMVTGLGCWFRAPWGRTCGLVLSTILLAVLPIGLLGWYAFFGSGQLFGPARFEPEELRTEYWHRKKRYGA